MTFGQSSTIRVPVAFTIHEAQMLLTIIARCQTALLIKKDNIARHQYDELNRIASTLRNSINEGFALKQVMEENL